jgi:hypothetical protein
VSARAGDITGDPDPDVRPSSTGEMPPSWM